MILDDCGGFVQLYESEAGYCCGMRDTVSVWSGGRSYFLLFARTRNDFTCELFAFGVLTWFKGRAAAYGLLQRRMGSVLLGVRIGVGMGRSGSLFCWLLEMVTVVDVTDRYRRDRLMR